MPSPRSVIARMTTTRRPKARGLLLDSTGVCQYQFRPRHQKNKGQIIERLDQMNIGQAALPQVLEDSPTHHRIGMYGIDKSTIRKSCGQFGNGLTNRLKPRPKTFPAVCGDQHNWRAGIVL